jgi:hypothetical protein
VLDPVSLIVGALVAGITAGIESAAEEAVVDGYRALRNRLTRYGPQMESSIERLEMQPSSPRAQDEIGFEIRRSGAANDPELTNLASRITALIHDPEQALLMDTDPVIAVRRSRGFASMSQLLDQHIRQVLDVREHFGVDDTDLLSTRIGQHGNLPDGLRSDLSSLHSRMRLLIYKITSTIEESRYREIDIALSSMSTSFAVRERAAVLVRADKQMHISYETLRLTIEFFSQLNSGVLDRLKYEHDARRESNTIFGNAILIFELADFVVGFIEEFQLANNISQIHQIEISKLNTARQENDALRDWLDADATIDSMARANTLVDIEHRQASHDRVEQEWDRYMSEIHGLQDRIGGAYSLLPTLGVIRENARLQIQTLQLLAMLRVLRQNSDSILGAVISLQGLQLAPLSPSRVRRLLGL